jgi:regulatory protein
MGDPAYAAALRLLARRDHFRAEIAQKLERKGFDPERIEAALERCSDNGLIDDPRLARRFAEIRSRDNGWGSRRIEAELRRRGVARSTAVEAARLDPDEQRAALSTALRRVQIRAPEGWWRVSDRRARMVSSLIARGFEADDAISAVERLAASREKSDHAFDDESGNP